MATNIKTSELPTPASVSLTVSGLDEVAILKSGSDYRETFNAIVAASATGVIVVSNSASIASLTTQVNAIVLLPTSVAADSGKLVGVNAGGSYVLIANTSGGFQGIFTDLADLVATGGTGTGGDWAILVSGGHGYWDTVSTAWKSSTDNPPASNLSLGTVTATTVGINITTGTSVTIVSATSSNAGLMSAADFSKLATAVTASAGSINNATIDSDRVNIAQDVLSPAAVIVWDIKDNGPIAEVSLDQDSILPLQTTRPGGTYMLRVNPNGFSLDLSAFEAPENGLEPTLSAAAGAVDVLMFTDWGTARVTVFIRKDVKGITS